MMCLWGMGSGVNERLSARSFWFNLYFIAARKSASAQIGERRTACCLYSIIIKSQPSWTRTLCIAYMHDEIPEIIETWWKGNGTDKDVSVNAGKDHPHLVMHVSYISRYCSLLGRIFLIVWRFYCSINVKRFHTEVHCFKILSVKVFYIEFTIVKNAPVHSGWRRRGWGEDWAGLMCLYTKLICTWIHPVKEQHIVCPFYSSRSGPITHSGKKWKCSNDFGIRRLSVQVPLLSTMIYLLYFIFAHFVLLLVH